MNTITAAAAADLISTFVDEDSSNPASEPKLLRILSLVNQFAWKNGVWPGMTAEFFVRVDPRNGELVTPHGYNNLLKINLNGTPTIVKDEYHQFHLNGNGSLRECCSNNWTSKVIYLGESPVLFQPNKDRSQREDNCQCVRVGVSADGNCTEPAETTVQGYYPLTAMSEPEKRIYTNRIYTDSQEESNACLCKPLSIVESKTKNTIDGVIFPIGSSMIIMDDICWGRIESISKGVTETSVDYWMISERDKITRMARLEPFETNASYRRYRVPEQCCKLPCVHALFKRSKPSTLRSMTQSLIIGDEEAIMSLAIGIYNRYYTKDTVAAVNNLADGLRALEACAAMSEGSEISNIEVSTDWIPEVSNNFDHY